MRRAVIKTNWLIVRLRALGTKKVKHLLRTLIMCQCGDQRGRCAPTEIDGRRHLPSVPCVGRTSTNKVHSI